LAPLSPSATGLGWANDVLKLSTHGPTHLDAPWHYASSAGTPAKGEGDAIQVEDVQTALAEINYTLQPLDIVLIHTGNDRLLGTPAYFTHGTA
jgi:kynurenine formamidase